MLKSTVFRSYSTYKFKFENILGSYGTIYIFENKKNVFKNNMYKIGPVRTIGSKEYIVWRTHMTDNLCIAKKLHMIFCKKQKISSYVVTQKIFFTISLRILEIMFSHMVNPIKYICYRINFVCFWQRRLMSILSTCVNTHKFMVTTN